MLWILFVIFIIDYISCAGVSYDEDLPVLGVIGGDQAAANQFPYQVLLRAKKNHICGGALIAKNIVITAAHCTRDEPLFSLTVVAGTNDRFVGGVSIRVDYVKEHPKYNPKTKEYDLAILFLQKNFKYGAKMKPIELPKAGDTIPKKAVAIVSGWGLESENSDKSIQLKFAYTPIWSKSKCYDYLKVIKAPVYCSGEEIGNNNPCSGDSGGPLVYDNKLFGVVSFGFGCGTPKKPAVYTNIAGLRDWIAKTAHI